MAIIGYNEIGKQAVRFFYYTDLCKGLRELQDREYYILSIYKQTEVVDEEKQENVDTFEEELVDPIEPIDDFDGV
jgi:hypothetical protein